MREMGIHYILSYNYRSSEELDKRYRKHVPTKDEAAKTKELMDKLEDFVIKTDGKEALEYFHSRPEGNIQYLESDGYVSIVNFDRDEVNVYGYGKTIEEAFLKILIDYEHYICGNYEWTHRGELNQQYSNRFLGGICSKCDNNSPFFVIELSLQDFRKYYGDDMPKDLIEYFNEQLNMFHLDDFEYSFEENCLVHKSSKNYVKK